MKYAVLLFMTVMLQSCADTKKEVVNDVATTNETEKEDASEALSEVNIPVYNFEQLQPWLNKQNDTTYVVNFWATWCKPCIKELPYFEEVTQQYADDKLKVILVSLDFPDKLKDQVAPFVEKRNLKSQVVLLDDPDANGWIPKVSEEWSGAIPATVIYKNNERRFYEKSFTREELFEEIKSIH